jgi:hypothetical protein
MAYASQSGRARTSAKNPQAFAVCMRCGFWYNHVDLAFQWEWSGAQLRNTYLLVCKTCLDVPQEQLRAFILPADPVPIPYPSVENFAQDETDYHTVSAPPVTDAVTGIPVPPNTLLVTEDCQNLTQGPMGQYNGLTQDAIMPWNGTAAYGVALPVFAMNSDGNVTITVICSAPHGLTTNDQICVEGAGHQRTASGFYSVTVVTATVFTYQTLKTTPAESLLLERTLVWTAKVGLPYGFTQIPLVGP